MTVAAFLAIFAPLAVIYLTIEYRKHLEAKSFL